VNLVFLPMAFFSGALMPLSFMPKFIIDAAPVWPAYHLVQMALSIVDAPNSGSVAGHVAVLAGVTLLFFLLAVRRMHGSGFRLLGPRPKRTLVIVASVCAAVIALSLSGVFGGKETDSASPGTRSETTGTPAAEAAAGIAAPAVVVLSDFDGGSAATAYGIGWSAAGDNMRGGNSTAKQRLVESGAGGSKGALEVTGTLGDGLQYPFAGTMFFPQGPPMQGLMDYSGKKTLKFQARGDGRHFMLMVISGLAVEGIPLMYDFETGPEWREVRLDLAKYPNVDWKRVRAIGVGTMGPVGAFRFQIDDVRVE
jgi:hypothetical protein